MMAEVQQPHKQHIATLPHTTTSSPVTTTPQQLLQKQHNHSKIIKKKEISPPRFNVCRLVFFSNAPASAAAPAAPTELSDDGGGSAATQTTRHCAHPETHPISSTKSTRCFFCASLTLKIQIRHCGVVARHAANSVLHLFADYFAHSRRIPVERAMLILLCRALFCCPGAAVFSARLSPSDERS